MSEALVEPRVRSDDRLLLTIVIAAAVHVMVVLGVRLPPEAPIKSRFSAMEVVLVPAPAPPTTALSAAPPDTTARAASSSDEPPLLPMPPVEKPVIKAAPTLAPSKAASARHAPPKAAPAPKAAPITKPAPAPATAAAPSPGVESSTAPLPTASQLIERSLAIAATGAGLIEDKTVNGQSQSERTLYIKRNTRDFAQAAYVDGLLRKAKAFGQLFQRGVPPGSVGLDIAIAADGSLAGVTVTKSSGVEATDAEALRIVEQAAPFAPLPPEMARKYDVAHIEFTMNITKDEGF
jgi:protein TonB